MIEIKTVTAETFKTAVNGDKFFIVDPKTDKAVVMEYSSAGFAILDDELGVYFSKRKEVVPSPAYDGHEPYAWEHVRVLPERPGGLGNAIQTKEGMLSLIQSGRYEIS